MLSYQTVEPHTLELLRRLMKEPMLADTRLVGGTSLALQYGHRSSVDLDFFGQVKSSSETLTNALKQWGEVKVLSQSNKIKCYIIDGIKVDIRLCLSMDC